MNWWQVTLIIIVGFAVLPYLLGPVFVYKKVWFSANPTIQPLTENELPEEAREFFSAATERFEKIGFTESWGDFRITNFFSDLQEQFIRAATNPETKESGGAVYIKQPIPHKDDLIAKIYGFSSELSDHTEIATGNSTHPSLPVSSENYREIVLPDIWDMELLYKIHQLATQKAIGSQKLWLPDHENVVEAMRHTFLKPARAIEQLELIRFEKESQRYVPTWKGAFLLTWQELWPLKWLRSRRLKKLAAALINAVE